MSAGTTQPCGRNAMRIDMPDADVWLYPSLFSPGEADVLFAALTPGAGEIDWKQETIRLYGTTRDLPRLTAWHGDPGKTYAYSGITVETAPWTATLLTIRDAIETVSAAAFNSVLLNLYRDGTHGVAWHSDDERELGEHPVIGSVSFGAARAFQMKHKSNAARRDIMLTHGSGLLMRGATQHHWLHRIPKTARTTGVRINLTFRIIAPRDPRTPARRHTRSTSCESR